nr:hypothetical protein [Paludibacteraceae bacterium]
MIQLKRIFCLLPVLVLVIGWTSCEKKTETTPSSETKLTAITFAANDSFPGLKKAVFTIDFAHDTALVYNTDSLPVGTRIDSVVTTFYFTTTIGYANFYSGDDTVLVTASDTLNFTPRPCRLRVISEDLKHERNYHIYVNVHKVDPDLYVWTQTKESLFTGNCDVHAENLQGTVQLYCQDGINVTLYRTTDGYEWTGPLTVNGLPKGANVRQIINSDTRLYYAENNHVYCTEDGMNWVSVDCSGLGFKVENMLFEYNDSIWAIVSDPASGDLWFATMAEGGTLARQNQIGRINKYYRSSEEQFPISDFSAVVFHGRSGRKRAMVMGGFGTNGAPLNSRWNLEWIDTDSTTGFYRLENFTIEQPEFTALTGAALVWYDYKMLLFGSQENPSSTIIHTVLESVDEGMNWNEPDSTKNMLPPTFVPRRNQAAVVTVDDAILLIGGQNRTTSFTDVWRGKKNSIEWL